MTSDDTRRSVLRFDDGGWAERVGNHVALDFVNTVSWRLDEHRRVDRLPDAAAVIRWAQFVGLVDEACAGDLAAGARTDPEMGRSVTAQVLALRELLYRVLLPVVTGDGPAERDVVALRHRLLQALRAAEIVGVMPLRWEVSVRTVHGLPAALGLAAWRLLEREDPSRLRQCRDASCGWLFLDRTKNASRVWCSSADCGNRTRARRYYQRHGRASSPAVERGHGDEDR
jgi:predicted RNA-binding Zn ribbon-like protein